MPLAPESVALISFGIKKNSPNLKPIGSLSSTHLSAS